MPTDQQLIQFIHTASAHTYFGGGERLTQPERPGFTELVYQEGELHYRDSYAGYYRSRGTELVRYQNIPIWASSYGGGMVAGKESLTKKTFQFLISAAKHSTEYPLSFRGPQQYLQADWQYRYTQIGDVQEFSGDEQIYFQGQLVFYHKVIGGRIIPQESAWSSPTSI